MAYTKLEKGNTTFKDMMNEFGVVTVMNAKIYEIPRGYEFNKKTAYSIRDEFKKQTPLAEIDTLKVANITIEGPTKTITGGQYSNPLIKFGKSARFEMQDALGRRDAIEAFGGAVNEFEYENGDMLGMHVTEDFAPARLIIGDSFFIDRAKGNQVKVDIVFYQVSPDSIFNLTQDAEGDATVFDMNADLLTTNILVGHKDNENYDHGVFYSIMEYSDVKADVIEYYTIANGKITITGGYTAKLDGADVVSGTTEAPTEGAAAKLVIFKDEEEVTSFILVG